MIEWINFIIMILTASIVLITYVKSVSPAQLERKIGEKAYKTCGRYRLISGFFMLIHLAQYGVYYFYPLQIDIPRFFPWNWWISIIIAVAIAIPSGYVWFRGMKDAGEETIFPKKEHTLYGGIYQKIRHPQAAGEVWYWFIFAFILNSPFLVVFSTIWIPIFILMCVYEEKDLVLRYGNDYLKYRENTGFFLPKTLFAK